MQLTVLDWDKLLSDVHFDSVTIEISGVAENVPKKDPDTGLILRMKTSLAHFKVISSRSLLHCERSAVGVETLPNDHIPVNSGFAA